VARAAIAGKVLSMSDSAIPSGRLYPGYTVAELSMMIDKAKENGDWDKVDKVRLALRQRDKTQADYIPTLHEQLNPKRI
jgi:hypothetical protein